jgi:hypothetical protein
MEPIIFNVVSQSVYPGVEKNDQINTGSDALAWWKEHARQNTTKSGKSAEETHLALGKRALNKCERANNRKNEIIVAAERIMKLFLVTGEWKIDDAVAAE